MLYSLFYDNRVFMNYWKKGNETLFDYKKIAKTGEKLRKADIDLEQIGYIVADPLISINGEKKIGFSLIQILWKIDENGEIATKVKKYTGFDRECEENSFPKVESGWEHAELVILSPTRESLRNYVELAEAKYNALKEKKGDEITFSFSQKKIVKINEWDYSIQRLYDNPLQFNEDNSTANNASISFLLFYNGTVSLFAGDSNPGDMIKTIERYLDKFGGGADKMPLDFMKMPHHASSCNNPLEFIEKFPTKYYLISTKGHNGYKHPGKQTLANIAKIHKDDGGAYIYCNYATWKNPNIHFKDKEVNWNVEDDLCEIKDSDNNYIQLRFCELKKKKIAIPNGTDVEIKISL